MGVKGFAGAFPGVGELAAWSGDGTLPLALGVAVGVDENWELRMVMGIGNGGGSTDRSDVVLTFSTTSSNGTDFILLCCSARCAHAEPVSYGVVNIWIE